MSTTQMDRMRRLPARGSAGRMAGGLGWFSIGLGLFEIAAARPIARSLGLRGQENLVRAYGVREIATGLGLLASPNRRPWVLGRLAGDALDLALLAAGARRGNPMSLTLALTSVLGATVLDMVCAEALRTEEGDRAARADATRAYATRSAFPRGIEAARAGRQDSRLLAGQPSGN
jgi:hypothetical protein